MKKIILEITDDAFEDISNYLRLQYMCGGSKVTLSLKRKKQSG
jgi:hypothetical protein